MENNPLHPLISDFQTLELRDNEFLLSEPFSLWYQASQTTTVDFRCSFIIASILDLYVSLMQEEDKAHQQGVYFALFSGK
jgi:hypothetical protein